METIQNMLSSNNPYNVRKHCDNCIYAMKIIGLIIISVCVLIAALFFGKSFMCAINISDGHGDGCSPNIFFKFVGMVLIVVCVIVFLLLTYAVHSLLKCLYKFNFWAKIGISDSDQPIYSLFSEFFTTGIMPNQQTICMKIFMTSIYFVVSYFVGVGITYGCFAAATTKVSQSDYYKVAFPFGIVSMIIIPICAFILICISRLIILIMHTLNDCYKAYEFANEDMKSYKYVNSSHYTKLDSVDDSEEFNSVKSNKSTEATSVNKSNDEIISLDY